MFYTRLVILILISCFNVILGGGAYASVQGIAAFEQSAHPQTTSDQIPLESNEDATDDEVTSFPPMYEEVIHDEQVLPAPFESFSPYASHPVVPLNSIALAPLHRPPSAL